MHGVFPLNMQTEPSNRQLAMKISKGGCLLTLFSIHNVEKGCFQYALSIKRDGLLEEEGWLTWQPHNRTTSKLGTEVVAELTRSQN